MHHPPIQHIPYHITPQTMKIMILIGIRFESYVDVLLYSSFMYYKEYIVNSILASMLITINNVKDSVPCRNVSFIDLVFTVVNGLLIILLIIMDIQMVMYVTIYLFCFGCVLLLLLFTVYGKSVFDYCLFVLLF